MKRTISKSERPYRLLLCVMISLLVIMLAGCSTSSDSDTNTRGFTDFATIEEEYLTTIESLNWPEGVTPPDALEGEDTGASFQIGYGDTKASNLWEYSWMQEWLDTYNTNPERAAKALAELEKAFDMPYMGTDRCDDATRKYLRDNIDNAHVAFRIMLGGGRRDNLYILYMPGRDLLQSLCTREDTRLTIYVNQKAAASTKSNIAFRIYPYGRRIL